MERELTPQERDHWNRQKELMVERFERWRAEMRPRFASVIEKFHEAHRQLLDARMECGFYEEDLAESHGDVEDVWH